MTAETISQYEPKPFDMEKEMRRQTELLSAINGKLGFFVFIIVAGIVIQILAALLSF